MPRIRKPKIGSKVWFKNFGWESKPASGGVKKTDWIEGVIVGLSKNSVTGYFENFNTNRGYTEDHMWKYTEGENYSCMYTEVSFTKPKIGG